LRRWQLPKAARDGVTVLLTIVTIAPPAYTSIRFDANSAKIWTNRLAYAWTNTNLPPGTVIVSETREFLLPRTLNAQYVKELRFLNVVPLDRTEAQYLVASSQNFGKYLSNCEQFKSECADYEAVFRQTEEVARFTPSPEHPGSELRILKVKR